MNPPSARTRTLDKLAAARAGGRPILATSAGTGLVARAAEAGGCDLIAVYNSGHFRSAGHGSLAGLLPVGDANQIVLEMGRQILPVVQWTPVIAGLCAWDPYRSISAMVTAATALGFAGVQNFPTLGLYDGTFRQNLEETGFTYAREVELVAYAHKQDLFTCPFVFDPATAAAMVEAGADAVALHVGVTGGGTVGATTVSPIDAIAEQLAAACQAAAAIRPDTPVLFHGGAASTPEAVRKILKLVPEAAGFFAASAVERLPVEGAVTDVVQQFTAPLWK